MRKHPSTIESTDRSTAYRTRPLDTALNASTDGFLSRKQMSALFDGHLGSSRIEAALEQLISLDAIYQTSQPSGGRPAILWSAIPERHLRKQPTRNQCDGGDGRVGTFATWEPRSVMDDPESHYVRGESRKLLRKAIHRLPPAYREVIQLRQAKEHSVREIAQSLGITVSAVKSRLSRAKSALRTFMV